MPLLTLEAIREAVADPAHPCCDPSLAELVTAACKGKAVKETPAAAAAAPAQEDEAAAGEEAPEEAEAPAPEEEEAPKVVDL